MKVIVVINATILTMETEEAFSGYAEIENGMFTKVEKGNPSAKRSSVSTVIDARGKWLLPGLVNTHGHLGAVLMRGKGDDLPLKTWLESVMWPNERKYTKETMMRAVPLAMLEMIKSGTTTFLDMYHLHMEEVAELVLTHNLKAVISRGMIGRGTNEEKKQKINDAINLFQTYNERGNGKLKVSIAPHAPYTCPEDFLREVIGASQQYNMLLHTHASETASEVQNSLKENKKTPIEYLHSLQFFKGKSLLAHATHITEYEMELLEGTKTSISHNAVSNLKLGSGIMPYEKLKNRSINISLATDSAASNNNLDMFEEMRIAALIHKGITQDPTITSAFDLMKMATINGAHALGFEDTGLIKKGYNADFILIDPDQPHLTPWNNKTVLSHIIYSVKGNDVTDVFIGGKEVYRNRQFITFDEEKIIAKAQEASEALER